MYWNKMNLLLKVKSSHRKCDDEDLQRRHSCKSALACFDVSVSEYRQVK